MPKYFSIFTVTTLLFFAANLNSSASDPFEEDLNSNWLPKIPSTNFFSDINLNISDEFLLAINLQVPVNPYVPEEPSPKKNRVEPHFEDSSEPLTYLFQTESMELLSKFLSKRIYHIYGQVAGPNFIDIVRERFLVTLKYKKEQEWVTCEPSIAHIPLTQNPKQYFVTTAAMQAMLLGQIDKIILTSLLYTQSSITDIHVSLLGLLTRLARQKIPEASEIDTGFIRNMFKIAITYKHGQEWHELNN